jgi:hypothetical protein
MKDKINLAEKFALLSEPYHDPRPATMKLTFAAI